MTAFMERFPFCQIRKKKNQKNNSSCSKQQNVGVKDYEMETTTAYDSADSAENMEVPQALLWGSIHDKKPYSLKGEDEDG
jgi:hypothetical protein